MSALRRAQQFLGGAAFGGLAAAIAFGCATESVTAAAFGVVLGLLVGGSVGANYEATLRRFMPHSETLKELERMPAIPCGFSTARSWLTLWGVPIVALVLLASSLLIGVAIGAAYGWQAGLADMRYTLATAFWISGGYATAAWSAAVLSLLIGVLARAIRGGGERRRGTVKAE